MEKHRGYRVVKRLIEAGDIIVFKDIFQDLPLTVAAKDMGIKFERLKGMLEQVEDFRLRELYLLAQLIGVEAKILFALADAQRNSRRKKK